MSLPLDDVRVVDFTRVLAGPHCTKHLLDMGADVIKIEPPTGDITRTSYPRQGEISGYFAQQNAGKRDLSIDLNFPEARKVVAQLCDTADVIVENFRPGALAAFGLDYTSVAARNPRVVYVSISGYGQRGSWRTRMAYAPTVQAETGFTENTLHQFGVEGDARRSDALSHADVYAGLHATIAVLAALTHAKVTGKGQYVDVAMAAVLTSINERVHYDLSDIDLGAEPPILGATDCAFFTGPEGEQFISPISLVGTDTFPFYLHAMRRPDLADDPRFGTAELRRANFAELHAIVQNWIDSFDSMDALDAQFDESKIATGRLRDIEDFAETGWAKDWVLTREVPDRHGGTVTIPAPPWHFSEHDGTLAEQIPAHQGEHNEEILKELGCADTEIQALKDSGALLHSVLE
ncbi:MAG TPA: CaiB/BaiF CoA-transferase family protein [Mycobacterium sp.]|nr:CaiB/BaiF CoA-transferase family protein [Mycobacterium sp.]